VQFTNAIGIQSAIITNASGTTIVYWGTGNGLMMVSFFFVNENVLVCLTHVNGMKSNPGNSQGTYLYNGNPVVNVLKDESRGLGICNVLLF
jgi:hypothetical protein